MNVLALLEEEALTPAEIAKRLKKKAASIRSYLYRLKREGVVEQLADGRYRLANGESEAEPQSHLKTEPRGLTVRTDGEESWPMEELFALQRENAVLRDENRQLRILAEQYKTWWLEAQRQAAREKVVLQQQITKLQGELKRLHADKTRRELCELLDRVTAALEQEKAAHQEAKSRWLSAEDRAWKAEHGLLTGGQIEQILWRELNARLTQSIMNVFR